MIKLYPSWFIFFFLVMTGLFMIISSDSWLVWWIGFELSLLGFLPMFLSSSLMVESMIKYFMVQASGSIIFLFSFLVEWWVSSYILVVSLAIKLGAFPFFFWVPLVMSGMSWLGCLILVTIQKLGPLFIVSMMDSKFMTLLLCMGLLSIFFGGLLGMSQSLMRGLMSYSSISHGGWILVSMVFDLRICFMYVILYFTLSFIIFLCCNKYNIVGVVSGCRSGGLDLVLALIVAVGFPPFSMFFMKFMIFFKCVVEFSGLSFFMVFGIMMYTSYYMVFLIPMVSKFVLLKGNVFYLFLVGIFYFFFFYLFIFGVNFC